MEDMLAIDRHLSIWGRVSTHSFAKHLKELVMLYFELGLQPLVFGESKFCQQETCHSEVHPV